MTTATLAPEPPATIGGARIMDTARQAHEQQMAARERESARMMAVEPIPFGETPDAEDRVEYAGFPLLKHWLTDPVLYARLHDKRAVGWADYRKGMKGRG